jgi:hypothetical protein
MSDAGDELKIGKLVTGIMMFWFVVTRRGIVETEFATPNSLPQRTRSWLVIRLAVAVKLKKFTVPCDQNLVAHC